MFDSDHDAMVHGWKAIHDEVPTLLIDTQLLKLRIIDAAREFKIDGDIEKDHGSAFLYQISVFFPHYFQKQVIKSQFSLYDAFAEDQQDPNSNTHKFQTSLIDSNLFKDVSSNQHTVPTTESINQDFRNSGIKVLRLKSAADWLDYVALAGTPSDDYIKQQAFLSVE